MEFVNQDTSCVYSLSPPLLSSAHYWSNTNWPNNSIPTVCCKTNCHCVRVVCLCPIRIHSHHHWQVGTVRHNSDIITHTEGRRRVFNLKKINDLCISWRPVSHNQHLQRAEKLHHYYHLLLWSRTSTTHRKTLKTFDSLSHRHHHHHHHHLIKKKHLAGILLTTAVIAKWTKPIIPAQCTKPPCPLFDISTKSNVFLIDRYSIEITEQNTDWHFVWIALPERQKHVEIHRFINWLVFGGCCELFLAEQVSGINIVCTPPPHTIVQSTSIVFWSVLDNWTNARMTPTFCSSIIAGLWLLQLHHHHHHNIRRQTCQDIYLTKWTIHWRWWANKCDNKKCSTNWFTNRPVV